MYNILQHTGEELTLVQPSFFKKKLDLVNGEEILASITLTGGLKAGAVFEIEEKKWEAKQLSFWKSGIGIFKFGYELPFAVFKQKAFSSSILELPMGQQLYFRRRSLGSIVEVINKQGTVLMMLKGKTAIKEKYVITIMKVTRELEEHPWIVLLPGFISAIKRKNS